MPQGRILVIRGGAIGDFILTLPVLSALRAHFPDARIELLAYPKPGALALMGGLVEHVEPVEARSLAGFFADGGELSPELSRFISRFDIIISYLFDPDGIFKANIARCGAAQFIQGPHRPDETVPLHAAKVFLKPLERLAIFDPEATPVLNIAAEANSAPMLALHPGSGSESKNWPESHWASLIDSIISTSPLELLLVGGEAELQKFERLARRIPAERLHRAFNLPLTELAGKLRACVAFAGHDSGITHLATALGLPCLVLWADSNQIVWSPKGTDMKILREPAGIHRLAPEIVLQELERMLPAHFTASRRSS